MRTVSVVGLGLSIDDLTKKHMKIISGADLLVGGRRHLSFFPDTQADTHVITKDIKSAIELIKKRMIKENIVVLASGDPMFYGIGSTIVREIGKEHVKIYSNISSVPAAFAAINEPWEDAKIISLHGRSCDDLSRILEKRSKIAFLTDRVHNPAWLASMLLNMEEPCFGMYVFEKLGSPDEKIMFFDDMLLPAKMEFSMPNVVILLRTPEHSLLEPEKKDFEKTRQEKDVQKNECLVHHQGIYPGMPVNLFFHENGLITKPEVRSVVLSKLKLISDYHTLWDIGAGSGSVSIEASRFLNKGIVIAVEKNKDRIALIQENVKKFGVSNVRLVNTSLPHGMEMLPAPNRIFIGGGGKDIGKIIRLSAEKLFLNGIIVINTVLLQTMEMARTSLLEIGFKTELIQLQVSVSKQMPFGERLEALNPVWIITGEKIGGSKFDYNRE